MNQFEIKYNAPFNDHSANENTERITEHIRKSFAENFWAMNYFFERTGIKEFPDDKIEELLNSIAETIKAHIAPDVERNVADVMTMHYKEEFEAKAA